MKYFQCGKDKILKQIDETDLKYQTDSEFDNIKFTPDIVCCDRRMRELNKDQYDHEVIQREYVENGGPAPNGTALMGKLGI